MGNRKGGRGNGKACFIQLLEVSSASTFLGYIFTLSFFFLVLLIIKIHVSASCLVSTVGVIYLNTTFFFQLSTRVCAIAGVMAYGYSNNAKHG